MSLPLHVVFCRHTHRRTQEEGDVIRSSICGKDSGLHTEHRFFDEPMVTRCILKRSQRPKVISGKVDPMLVHCLAMLISAQVSFTRPACPARCWDHGC